MSYLKKIKLIYYFKIVIIICKLFDVYCFNEIEKWDIFRFQ